MPQQEKEVSLEQFKAFLEQFHTTGVSDAYRFLGCHAQNRDGVDGFVFGPGRRRRSILRVTGDFNSGTRKTQLCSPWAAACGRRFRGSLSPVSAIALHQNKKGGRTVYKTDYGNHCGVLPGYGKHH